MYPEKNSSELNRNYFSESEYFNGKFNFVHTYLHTDYKYKMHSHQFYEINIVIAGKGRHYIEESYLDAVVGDIFVIPPKAQHGYYSNEKLDIYHILIKNEIFSRYNEELAEIDGFQILFDFEPLIRTASGKKLNSHIEKHQLFQIKETLERMEKIEKNGKCVHLNITALQLIIKLCEIIHKESTYMPEREFLSVLEFIKNNLGSKLTLPQLAKCANMSVPTFSRHFKSAIGLSPMQYVIDCRRTKAKELLEENRLSRTDIAQVCGFYDLTHLNKYLNIK